jgi:hypothetical protein
VVSALTFIFLNREDEEGAENNYFSFAHTIEDASQFHITNMNLAFKNLGEIITTAAQATNASFPFVTVPKFEVYGRHARLQSGIETFTFNPFITDETRAAWQAYSIQNQGWLKESRDIFLGGDEGNHQDYIDGPITPIIWQRQADGSPIPTPGPDTYAPVWQVSVGECHWPLSILQSNNPTLT